MSPPRLPCSLGELGAVRGKSGEAESRGPNKSSNQLYFLRGHDIWSGLKKRVIELKDECYHKMYV